MSSKSNIVFGVSDKLGVKYLKSFNDEDLELMFSAIVTDVTPLIFSQFAYCYEAVNFLQNKGFSKSKSYEYVQLNIEDGLSIKLDPEEVEALIKLEKDEEMFSLFEMYAEKMSRPGRQLAAAALEDVQDDEDQDNEVSSEDDQDDEINFEDDNYLKHEAEVATLRFLLNDANNQIVNLEKKVEKSRRDMAMEWIMNMDNMQFEQRLLSENPNYKLPDFVCAQPDDEDYPNFRIPQRDIAVQPKKRPLTFEDVGGGIFNFACHKRDMLRYTSQEEFKAEAYEDHYYSHV